MKKVLVLYYFQNLPFLYFHCQNSKFYNDVIIKYNDQVIKCDNLDLKISDNIAIAYNNVTLQNKNSLMKAEKITMNILTKDISINSNEEIEVTKN